MNLKKQFKKFMKKAVKKEVQHVKGEEAVAAALKEEAAIDAEQFANLPPEFQAVYKGPNPKAKPVFEDGRVVWHYENLAALRAAHANDLQYQNTCSSVTSLPSMIVETPYERVPDNGKF